jgi:DNA-binding MurR/RpiR family transcriptional regulator
MTDTTRNGFTEIDKLIEGYATVKSVPKIFPYTARELAERYGLSNSTVTILLHKKLDRRGKFWVYRNIQEREHE